MAKLSLKPSRKYQTQIQPIQLLSTAQPQLDSYQLIQPEHNTANIHHQQPKSKNIRRTPPRGPLRPPYQSSDQIAR